MRVLPRNESVFEAEIAEKDVTNVAELRSFDKRNGGPFPQKKGQKFLRRILRSCCCMKIVFCYEKKISVKSTQHPLQGIQDKNVQVSNLAKMFVRCILLNFGCPTIS